MRLLTVREGADVLRVKPARAYQLIRENAFPPGVVVRIGSKQLRFSEDGLRAWIASGGNTETDDLKVGNNSGE
jgi:predicted DNA-binding transcriptional regulator AlpA